MYFGAKMQKYTSEKWIKLILGAVVFIVAAKYILIAINYRFLTGYRLKKDLRLNFCNIGVPIP